MQKKMKVGDLVACNHPSRSKKNERRLGVIIDNAVHNNGSTNKMFKVLWQNGRIDNRLWDYDLKLVERE